MARSTASYNYCDTLFHLKSLIRLINLQQEFFLAIFFVISQTGDRKRGPRGRGYHLIRVILLPYRKLPFISPWAYTGAHKRRGLYLRVLKTVIANALRKNLKRNYSGADQNALYSYWFLMKFPNVIISSRGAFILGAYNRTYLFLQADGPISRGDLNMISHSAMIGRKKT